MKDALFWSGGNDSTLLLALMIEENLVFDIVQFRNNWTKKQSARVDALIKKYKLKVFSYSPLAVNLIGKDKDISVVFEYALGGSAIPVVRDVIDGDLCVADLTRERTLDMPFDWDRVFIGTRKDDTHPFLGQPVKEPEFKVGTVTVIAPLWNWTREKVVEALRARGFDTEVSEEEGTGEIFMCSNCLDITKKETYCPKEKEIIPTVKWSPEGNLEAMRQVYG